MDLLRCFFLLVFIILTCRNYKCISLADKGVCKMPPEPRNGTVNCFLNDRIPDRYSCIAECEVGYKFPLGNEVLIHICNITTNEWKPEYEFPDCEAVCNTPCQNGGICVEGNECICTPDFEGDRCENEKTSQICISGWTEYFNTDKPEVSDIGDDETLKRIRGMHPVCPGGIVDDVECKAIVNGTSVDYRKVGTEGLECSKDTGFICNKKVRLKKCEDFAVIFSCKCDVCKYPPEPRYARMRCSPLLFDKNSYACLAECDYGYRFPNGDTQATLTCNTTIKTWNPEDKFPDCEDECDPPCQNGGICENGNKCICNSYFEGDMCENVACNPPCRNGGICMAGNACICTPGFEGDRCENDVSCPAGMVYVYTSPCPKTCENYKTYREDDCLDMHQNTCICPEDEVLKLGKCVNTSACVVCDEEGHIVGDVWQVEPCEICVCRPDLTTKCIEQLCPEPPICEEQETILKVKGLNDTCCDSFQCVPTPGDGDCEEPKVEACPTGKALIMKQFGKCPVYQCECFPWLCPPIVTPHLDDGESFRLVTTDCCPEVEITCNRELCAPSPNCSEGFKLSAEKGRCCFKGKCVPQENVCVYEHHYEVVNGTELPLPPERYYDKEYQPGELWFDGLCRECTCIDIKGRLISQCELENCQSLGDFSDSEKYIRTEFRVPGYCCPMYVRELCVDQGVSYRIGDEWSSPENNFCRTISRCVLGTTGEAVLEVASQCEKPCIR